MIVNLKMMRSWLREYWWIALAVIFFFITGLACPPLFGEG
jgi:LPS O-antigen subunit length determinant protein (WzzB/FepE family)